MDNYKLVPVETEDIDDLEENIFNDENEHFVNFKNEVKEWLLLDDDIVTLQKAIKERKQKKDLLTPGILEFMDRFKINDLNTQEGKVKFTKSMYTKPLNKDYLVAKLSSFFRDYGKGQKVASYILENRDKQEKVNLRRVKR
jgi:hypothetical protein